ncbi:MAG: HAD family hydrolase [Anaerolineae bacterium]|nr:HAD family hydrolase [Anaerolineae bacterium]
MEKLALILDADDTLWENNLFYERAVDAFAGRMAAEGFDPLEARATFDQVERERVPVVGYAPEEFVRSMALAYHRLCDRHGQAPETGVEREVVAIARQVIDYPIVLLDGVAETLPILHRCCRLIVLTKGDRQVQQDKVRRSGLECYLEAVHVVAEKGVQTLHDLLRRYQLDPRCTWMVGNSPRSDVNPALQAGIGAVYIPYAFPWSFEDAAIVESERFVRLERFSQLLEHFSLPEAA